MKYVHMIILFVWQLPQNILGLILLKVFNCVKSSDYYVTYSSVMTGISLGNFIVIRSDLVCDKTVSHEKGHQIQSRLLGPLYLVLIGLPSITGNILHRFLKFNYYKQPWEAWADKLGNVIR